MTFKKKWGATYHVLYDTYEGCLIESQVSAVESPGPSPLNLHFPRTVLSSEMCAHCLCDWLLPQSSLGFLRSSRSLEYSHLTQLTSLEGELVGDQNSSVMPYWSSVSWLPSKLSSKFCKMTEKAHHSEAKPKILFFSKSHNQVQFPRKQLKHRLSEALFLNPARSFSPDYKSPLARLCNHLKNIIVLRKELQILYRILGLCCSPVRNHY